MASGWRSLRNSGTPSWVCSLDDYSSSADLLGPPRVVSPPARRFRCLPARLALLVTLCVCSLPLRLRRNTFPLGVEAGDVLIPEADIEIVSPVNVKAVEIWAEVYFVAGTSPADQPYGNSSTYVRSSVTDTTAGAQGNFPEGFRVLLRGEPVRVPENINGTSAVSGQMYVNVTFSGAGSCDVIVGRAAVWRHAVLSHAPHSPRRPGPDRGGAVAACLFRDVFGGCAVRGWQIGRCRTLRLGTAGATRSHGASARAGSCASGPSRRVVILRIFPIMHATWAADLPER